MNYDLAFMALEGMSKSPIAVRTEGSEVIVEGSAASFKELARLCLLLGGAHLEDEVELQPGVHVTSGSLRLRLRIAQVS
ncbi:MAG: hypothetical protein JJE51_15170 [Thermoanaerobaculia bacterium]|nr:hypothetical protein [Thermoanaerobaculia bacterium]